MTPDNESAGRPDRTTTHGDGAAYALGALSESETAAFEAHLDNCSQCQQELDSLVATPDLLANADAFAIVVDRDHEASGRRWISKVLRRLRLHRPTRAQAAAIASRDLRDEARRFERQAARFTGELAVALHRSYLTDRELP